MKKHIFGRQLSRDTKERKALFRGLINSLVMQESIKTTEAKAKAIRGQVEKLITKAKRKGKEADSLLKPLLHKASLEKVINDLAVRFANRPGGYTRIFSLSERFGDNAKMVIIEFVDKKENELTIINKELSNNKQDSIEKINASVPAKTKQSKKPEAPKKEKTTAKKQRPPSRNELRTKKKTK